MFEGDFIKFSYNTLDFNYIIGKVIWNDGGWALQVIEDPSLLYMSGYLISISDLYYVTGNKGFEIINYK